MGLDLQWFNIFIMAYNIEIVGVSPASVMQFTHQETSSKICFWRPTFEIDTTGSKLFIYENGVMWNRPLYFSDFGDIGGDVAENIDQVYVLLLGLRAALLV